MSKENIPVGNDEIRALLKSQYHASLAMLRDTIERCPDDLWNTSDHPNAFWQIAYHAVFFAHFYLHRDKDCFQPWEQHQANVQNEDGLPGPPDGSALPLIPTPYTRSQVLAYWEISDRLVDPAVNDLALHDPNCGFPWYKNVTKLEHQFISIRHIQHHAAQLADRLRSGAGQGTRWVGSRRSV
jgi:DinB superfamily